MGKTSATVPKRTNMRAIPKSKRVVLVDPVTGTPLSVPVPPVVPVPLALGDGLGEPVPPPVPLLVIVNVEVAVSVLFELGSSPVTVTVYVPRARSVVGVKDQPPLALALTVLDKTEEPLRVRPNCTRAFGKLVPLMVGRLLVVDDPFAGEVIAVTAAPGVGEGAGVAPPGVGEGTGVGLAPTPPDIVTEALPKELIIFTPRSSVADP